MTYIAQVALLIWLLIIIFNCGRVTHNGDPDRIRTYDLQIRNLTLYPAELRDLINIKWFTLYRVYQSNCDNVVV